MTKCNRRIWLGQETVCTLPPGHPGDHQREFRGYYEHDSLRHESVWLGVTISWPRIVEGEPHP